MSSTDQNAGLVVPSSTEPTRGPGPFSDWNPRFSEDKGGLYLLDWGNSSFYRVTVNIPSHVIHVLILFLFIIIYIHTSISLSLNLSLDWITCDPACFKFDASIPSIPSIPMCTIQIVALIVSWSWGFSDSGCGRAAAESFLWWFRGSAALRWSRQPNYLCNSGRRPKCARMPRKIFVNKIVCADLFWMEWLLAGKL